MPFTFAGFHISRKDGSCITIDQILYSRKLEQLSMSSPFSQFRSMRMRVAWLSNTRPDIQYEISQLAQVTQEKFNRNASTHLKRLNSVVKYALDNPVHLQFPKLDVRTIRLIGDSDAVFANNHDLSSQLGRIILLQDGKASAIPLSFKS